jgi:hypothetical protein
MGMQTGTQSPEKDTCNTAHLDHQSDEEKHNQKDAERDMSVA